MVYGELGVTYLVLHAPSRMIMFLAGIYKSSSTPKTVKCLVLIIFESLQSEYI